MNVNIDELEQITASLFSRLRESVGNEVEINSDYFWHIPDKEKYNPNQDPKNLDLGQLSDDMEELRRLLKEDDAISYDLERLAHVLAAINNEFVNNKSTF